MLDIQFIRDNRDLVTEKTKQKGFDADIGKLLELDEQVRHLRGQAEQLRAERNRLAEAGRSGRPDDTQVQKGRDVKTRLSETENSLDSAQRHYDSLLNAIPNMAEDDVPVGGESENVEISKHGDTPSGAKDHLELCQQHDWVDFTRGAKVSGSKFYYLKGNLALLENALHQFGLRFVLSKGFSYITVPHLVNSRTAAGTGFAPRSSEQSDEYYIEGEDLTLIATAEVALTGLHADEILEEQDLPKLYAGYSPCYRKEAGTYGKHTRGLFRVHQFNKLEMYAFCMPEQSRQMHEQIREIEEEIWQALGIPYRVVNIASAELGTPAVKKYDIEYWSPVDTMYRELTSCSNCTDFQARSLGIRVRRADGSIDFVHTLNGTAISMARTLVAVIENYQTPDGSVKVPEALLPYMAGATQL